MRLFWLVLLTIVSCDALLPDLDAMKIKNATAPKTMFTLPAGDAALLDEINTVRRVIAKGFFNDPLKKIATMAWDGAKAVFKDASDRLLKLADFIVNELLEFADDALEWGAELFSSESSLADAAKSVENFAEETGKEIKNVGDKVGGWLGSTFGKRRKRNVFKNAWNDFEKTLDNVVEVFRKPQNTFGPATDMNMITWNRRLAQLAMTINYTSLREVEYEGKKYRVTKYGTLATYVISNLLGETILQMFKTLRIGYLACKLWFFKVEIPWTDETTTYDTTLEIMFAARVEVGCFYTWPDTICIIGPLKPRSDNMLYEEAKSETDVCSACKHGCVPANDQVMCSPPPSYFYALREKYKKHLRPKIEKFEVVEGFDGNPPPIGRNFMIDSANSSMVFVSFIFLALSILI